MTEITKRDLALVFTKGGLGAIPIVGALAVEVVNAIVPDRRIARLEELVTRLSEQLDQSGATEAGLRDRFTDPAFIDLLEEGMEQSARTAEQNRIEQLAAILKNSLLDKDVRRLRDKRLMQILAALSDAEVVTLMVHTNKVRQDASFYERHEDILGAKRAHLGASQAQHDDAALQEDREQHLIQLGLTKTDGELAPMGRLLLRRIDFLEDQEW